MRQSFSFGLARSFRVVPLLAILVVVQVVAGSARATHVPGATYTGTHQAGGTQPGGKVEFTVSATGTRLAGLRLPDLLCLARGAIPASDVFGDINVVNHSFNKTVSGGDSSGSFFRGAFSGTRSAAGTLEIRVKSANFSCEMDTLSWTASVSRLSPSSPQCVVPNIKGKTLPVAKAALTKAHCSVGKISKAYSQIVKSGRVVSQKPPPGARRSNRAKVDLVLSRGRKP